MKNEGSRVHRVLNLGAGVQSTTIYLMYTRGEIEPGIECAIFADTGDEPEAVYAHLEWMKGLNGPPIIVRSVGSRIGDDLVTGRNSKGQRFASIPAFTAVSDGAPNIGKVRRQCTREYKIEVIKRYIRHEMLGLRPYQKMPKNVLVHQAYGISLDEAGRSRRIQDRLEVRPWIEPHFPLLERGMTRGDCYGWLKDYGVPHEVQKSACVFCPFKNNAEWRRLRDTDPVGWARAIEIDEAMRRPGVVVNRGMDQKLYVHRSCMPLASADLGDADPRQYYLINPGWASEECAGMCGV